MPGRERADVNATRLDPDQCRHQVHQIWVSRVVPMFWRIAICLIGMSSFISAADARPRRQIDATPFSHAPCSVLDGRPCTPSFCSVFNHGPCIPEIDYPYGENLQLTIQTMPSKDDATKYVRPDHDLDTIGD